MRKVVYKDGLLYPTECQSRPKYLEYIKTQLYISTVQEIWIGTIPSHMQDGSGRGMFYLVRILASLDPNFVQAEHLVESAEEVE